MTRRSILNKYLMFIFIGMLVLTSCTKASVKTAESTVQTASEKVEHLKTSKENVNKRGEGPSGKASVNTDQTQSTRQKKWTEDINFYSSALKDQHEDLYRNISQVAFDAEIELLINRLGHLKDEEVILELKRLTAKIGDSHTNLDIITPLCDQFIPVKFAHIGDDLYCVNANQDYSQILFKKIIAINDLDPQVIMDAFKALEESETTIGKDFAALAYLRLPDIYQALGFASPGQDITLKYEEKYENPSQVHKVTIEPIKLDDLKSTQYIVDFHINNNLSFLDVRPEKNYWYDYNSDHNILAIHYTKCKDMPDYSFKDFSNDVWRFVEDNPVEKIVLDMRYNTGGFPFLLDDFRVGLLDHKSFNSPEKLYVVIGNQTFSAGVLSAVTMKRLTNAVLIGEPTSGSTSTFGSGSEVKLPHSNILLKISGNYREYYPNYDHDTLIPDIPIYRDLNDYQTQSDPVMRYIIGQ